MYYAIFMLGWGLFPRVSNGPLWYKGQMMFSECNVNWWAQLLLVSNIFPFFQACNEGCFYWGWIVCVDMQLSLLAPLFVVAYLKSKWLGHSVLLFFLIGFTLIGTATVVKYDIKAGIFAS